MGAVIVVASGNTENNDVNVEPQIGDDLPQSWANDVLPNLIVVGSNDKQSRAALTSRRGPKLTVYAPGKDVDVAGGKDSGTSLGQTPSISLAGFLHLVVSNF